MAVGGGFTRPKPNVSSTPQSWPPSHKPSATTQAGPTKPVGITPPPVPTVGGGAGDVSVNTDLLSTVADNMDTLYDAVKAAYAKLNELTPIAPGAFWDAYQLQTAVGSPNDGSTSDLVNSYLAVLTDLGNGLTDIKNTLNQMRSTYTTFDDLNKAEATDIQSDLSTATAEFSNMMAAEGGTGGTTTTPGGPGGPGGNSSPGGSTASALGVRDRRWQQATGASRSARTATGTSPRAPRLQPGQTTPLGRGRRLRRRSGVARN